LRKTGLLAADYPVSSNAVSGYTGDGKELIARMQSAPAIFLWPDTGK